jgi:small-conductance mechanosensitive channel
VDPAPLVLLRAFGESSLDFELRIWTARPERMLATRSELSVAIHAALAAAGIEIPFPQRDLRLVAVEPDAAEALAAASGAPANAASAAASPASPAASSAVKR